MAFNDRCATGVLDAFLRARVTVPDEISVVGFDDSHLARLAHIDLTTVGQDVRRLADLAVGRAVARLEGEATSDGGTSGKEMVIAPHLVTRSTTAGPRKGWGAFGGAARTRPDWGAMTTSRARPRAPRFVMVRWLWGRPPWRRTRA